MNCFLKEIPDNILDSSLRNKHQFSDNVDIIGEPLGYELGVGDEFMDFDQEFKSNLNEKIDKLNENTSHSCKKSTFVTVAWSITRPGLWFSIEPIENINQFQRVVTNIWARFLPENQYYQPFRVRLSDVNKKRLIASECEETNAAKRSRKFY